ncbi:unnamed protein product [Onchocerca ochengi]|uniref:Helitron_like_N domain-containing protein n=1 Tax=Onchocerca ochengi TaxID=42157 RepID=A0A182EU39_ONCOC|nr:unnamed protein product [Onchocerca ochengi]
MTSFGAEIITTQFMPNFKVKGQICHKAGSLFPLPDGQHKFLQMYFIGNSNDELNARWEFNLVRLFKTAIDMMPSDTYKIFIHADKISAAMAAYRRRRFIGRRIRRRRYRYSTRVSRDITFGSACFDLQAGGRSHPIFASSFGLPNDCPVKIYGAIVWLATSKDCTPGVLRVQVGGGGDKTDVAATRLTCITAGVVRRMWLRLPSHVDYHLFLPTTAVVSLAHGTDCGGGGGKIQCMYNNEKKRGDHWGFIVGSVHRLRRPGLD